MHDPLLPALHRLVDPADPWADRREFLEEVLLSSFEQRQLQTQAVTAMPLYPTEAILWDDNQVPDMHYTGGQSRYGHGLAAGCTGASAEK